MPKGIPKMPPMEKATTGELLQTRIADRATYREPEYTTGRPTKMTPETIRKLEEAFAIGASDGEACFYADISKVTLYAYQEKYPEFLNRKNALKERPVLLARQTVVKAIVTDPNVARWYLERRSKTEFAIRTELTAADGDALAPVLVKFVDSETNAGNTDTEGI